MNSKTEELLERTFLFGIDTLNLLLKLPNHKVFSIIIFQLAKASTSTGANYEEAQAAESKKDFEHKISIVLKEVRESNYWLRVLNAILSNKNSSDELQRLLNESLELKKIFTTIRFSLKKK
jgi:four helix bundle protein